MEIKRFKGKIRNRLILVFLIPTILIVFVFGLSIYFISQRGLEEELSKRLISIALSCGTQIPVESLIRLVPGDEDTRLYKNVREKLFRLQKVNNIERIYIFNINDRSLVDTNNDVSIGFEYAKHRLDQDELQRVKSGAPASSVLFKGSDGKNYKTGYAPVKGENSDLIIIGVEGSAEFYSTLRKLNRNLLWLLVLGILSITLASIIFSRKIVAPIKKLVSAASRISEGNLNVVVPIDSNDEIGFLSHRFNQMRENLLERDNRLQMMLHGVAHEVRNPLGGMKLFIDLLEEEIKNNPTTAEYIQKIQKELNNLGGIVNEFLDYAKHIALDKKIVDPRDFVNDLMFYVKEDLEKKNIKFQANINLDNQAVIFDPEYMKRVFLNLFKNSIQAISKNKGEISINMFIQDMSVNGTNSRNLRITFADNGTGIKDENKEKLFTPFFTTKERGTGLGLPFVAKIIEEHNGTIKIDSKYGVGTAVVINLPV